MEDILVTFPGGKRVDAQVGAYVVHTDQPASAGGNDSAPGPFDLFLASLAACAGIYVLGFCQSRDLDTTGLGLRQHVEVDEATKLPKRITIEITLPRDFPEKYRTAVVRAAEGCKVKKTITQAPSFDIVVT